MLARSLDNLNGAGKIPIARNYDGSVIGIVVSQIKQIDGEGNINTFFDVNSTWSRFEAPENDREIRFMLDRIQEFLLPGITLGITGLIGQGSVIVNAGKLTVSDQLADEQLEIHIDPVKIFLQAMEEI